MKRIHLWAIHLSRLLNYRLGGSIVFDVLWRMMTSFITRQQYDNIPHVDRTPYSPQHSRGSAQAFLPGSAQGHHHCSHESFLPVVLRNCSQMSSRLHVRVAIIKLPSITVTKSPPEISRTRHHARGAMMQTCETVSSAATASVKCLQQLNPTMTTPFTNSVKPHQPEK